MVLMPKKEKERKSKRRVPPEAEVIGHNLRMLRKQVGLSQKQMAGILGISFQQIQKYEHGENRLPLEKLFFLKEYFAVSYDVFFAGLGSGERTGSVSWQGAMGARLSQVESVVLQKKIERVVAIMME